MKKAPYIFLICPDAHLLREHLQTLFSNQTNGFERKVFWGDEDLPDSFWQDLTVKSLFSTPKALVIRRAHVLKAATWDKLDQVSANIASDVSLFFCLEGSWDKKKAKAPVPAVLSRREIWKRAEKNGWSWQSQGLTTESMPAFIKQWAARTGITLEGNTMGLLARRMPEDALAAALELDKLELAAGDDKKLTPEHVELVPPSGEMDFFDFMEVISKGGPADIIWKRVLENHQEKDSIIFLLISYLGREARTLWMLAHGEDNQVKMHPYVKKLKTPLARKLGPQGITRMIDIAFDAEISIKTGQRKPEQALDFLVSNLTLLFGRR
ncbi:MAG: DNA polymerase III subunit delta [Desulfovibrio sp.]